MKHDPLRANELKALWHAIQWMDLCLKQPMEGNPAGALEAERERLKLARSAYRKINAARKRGLAL